MRSQSGKQRLPLLENRGFQTKHDGGSQKDATTQARTEDTVLVVSEQEPKSLDDSIHRETIQPRERDRDRSIDRSTASLSQTWRLHIVASPCCTLPKHTCPLISSRCKTNPPQPHCPKLFVSRHTLHLHHTPHLHLHTPKHPFKPSFTIKILTKQEQTYPPCHNKTTLFFNRQHPSTQINRTPSALQ